MPVEVLSRQRHEIARRFARIAGTLDGVKEVRLYSTTPDLEIGVVVEAADLEEELRLRGTFVDLMCQVDPSLGELWVFAESDGVPAWAHDGQQLATA